MLVWIIIAIVVLWIILSAAILISLSIMSSRFNQGRQYPDDFNHPKDSPRDEWPSQEGNVRPTSYISSQ